MSSMMLAGRTLNSPTNDALVDLSSGMATDQFDKWIRNAITRINSLAAIRVSDYGARFTGKDDDTFALQQAINAAVKQGGGLVFIDQPGTLAIQSVFTPVGDVPITITGLGTATTVKRFGALNPGVGLIDISGSNVSLSSFVIDGATTVPVGLQYNVDFVGIGGNDPMHTALTRNTSVWVHGNTSKISVERVIFQHAGGYSLLLDAMDGVISDVDVINSFFMNNRPTLFGTNPGQLIYGSWNGGLFAKGDGRTLGSGIVRNLLVRDCKFLRNTGNCCWSHLFGLTRLHENFRFIANYFEDTGLDGILVGGVTGGIVALNDFRRVGYVTVDDTSKSIPRWLSGNLNAVALDSAGIVKGVPYSVNTFLNINGGCIDADGHADSSIVSNVGRVSYSTEPEYALDDVAISGPNNNGQNSYFFNLNNSNQEPEGAINIELSGNTAKNMRAGSFRFYSGRNISGHGNTIIAPTDSIIPPVSFGPVGPGPFQRCFNIKFSGNSIDYSPTTKQPAVFEDDTYSNFLPTEVNFVYDNIPTGNTNAFEFSPSPNSGSKVSTYFPPTFNYVAVENGVDHHIKSPAGSGGQLTEGLIVTIKLAHALQAGANDYDHNASGTPIAIKSHFNPANNIATAYPAGATVALHYNGTAWEDMAQ